MIIMFHGSPGEVQISNFVRVSKFQIPIGNSMEFRNSTELDPFKKGVGEVGILEENFKLQNSPSA